LLASCFGEKCFGSRPDFQNQQKIENRKQVERKEERIAKQSHPTATAGLSFNTTKVKAGNAREKEMSKQKKPPIEIKGNKTLPPKDQPCWEWRQPRTRREDQ
jgi:hypothetical protein